MKLLRVRVLKAATCGGLLDGLDQWFRSPRTDYSAFEPLCFVGPNGAGKSQFLQVLAEMLQAAYHACIPSEERSETNPDLQFELEYLFRPAGARKPTHVRISRLLGDASALVLTISKLVGSDWIVCPVDSSDTHRLLPTKVVGYTSGGNETLSLPFLVSRSGYADGVSRQALETIQVDKPVDDTRLMLVDYGTHLEVLAANLLLGTGAQRQALLTDARLKDIHSFRCIIQLAHSAVPKRPAATGSRKGVQLTKELESYIDKLRRCATCSSYDEKTETYVCDFWINEATRRACRHFWNSVLDLYSSLHKLSMLNDLAIPKRTRDRFRRETKARHFASRLPEPQDEEKVFRFERVQFTSDSSSRPIDYVSLSDGEHQLGQLLGTLCMVYFPGALFILDEPESHFNPHWRVRCISRILDLPTENGSRRPGEEDHKSAQQECILTTHSPFVPSDMPRERVFVFEKGTDGKVSIRNPDVETYGTTFDTILEECFGVRPPMSKEPLREIETLRQCTNAEELRAGIQRLGSSVEKVVLLDRLRQLSQREGS